MSHLLDLCDLCYMYITYMTNFVCLAPLDEHRLDKKGVEGLNC